MTALLCCLALALAEPPPDAAAARARAVYEEATTLYKAGRFTEAADRFEAAYALLPSPRLLYNQALAWEKAGRLERAAVAVSRYVPLAEAKDRAEAQKWLGTLEKKLSKTHARVTVDAGAPFTLGGEPHQSPWTGWVAAGEVAVRAAVVGFLPAERLVVVRAGEAQTVTLRPLVRSGDAEAARSRLAPAAPAIAVPDAIGIVAPRTARPMRTWGWSAVGVGLAAAATGAVLNLGVGFAHARDAGDLDPASPPYAAAFDALVGDATDVSRIGYALYGVGGALVATGTVLLILDARTTLPALSVVPTEGGALLGVAGGF